MAVSQLIAAFINMLDTFMLGGVSEQVLTAAGLANKVFFVYILIVYGVGSASGIFMAQHYGKGDVSTVKRFLGLALIGSSATALIFTLGALIFTENIMHMFTADPAVVGYGVQYIRIVAISYLPTAISNSIYGALRCARHPKIPMLFSVLALCVNATFNSLFIFVFNMGITGAAYATLIARCVEAIGVTTVLLLKNTALKGKLLEYFRFRRDDVRRLIKTGWPVIAVEGTWALGNTMYMLAFRAYGSSAQAAVQVGDSFLILFNVLSIALGCSAAVIIGNTIGAGKKDVARGYSRTFYRLSIIMGAIIAALGLAFIPLLPIMFPKLTAEGLNYARQALLVVALSFVIRCMEFMLMVGVLRAGGDTRFCIVLDMTCVWVITLPLLLVASYVLHLPFVVVYIMINIEMLIKIIVASFRFFGSDVWLNDLTVTEAVS